MRIFFAALLGVRLILAEPVPPPRGVKQFETSAFCRKYRCVFSGLVEPLSAGGVSYNYRVRLPDGTMHPAQFGMRLTASGERVNPYLIVRWPPAHELGPKDVVGINELVSEITGHSEFDAATFVLRFERERSAKPAPGDADPVPVGGYTVRCSYTAAKELTLLIETRPSSIGVATMTADGTIVLHLRAVSSNGTIAEGQLTYPKGHKDYDSILKHLGGLKPGETKSVAPWE